ncbi:hypothetical protein BN1723_001900 [Verticillium longisporum]|uniref:Uncharacterized protein n=1 Tax=Verticillium longisporum TaxID=100787 RepID=A0A0G4KSE3_VERLO|nr:hypothetical protein BN1723_001900 [Verticillium longisporum]
MAALVALSNSWAFETNAVTSDNAWWRRDRRSDKQNGETLLRQGPPSDNPADGGCQCQGSQYCTESPGGVQKAVAAPLSVFRVRQVPRARMIMAGN